jgi:hypothetical protein
VKVNQSVIDGVVLLAALAGAGALARKGTAASWERLADKPPPDSEQKALEADLREAVAWALLSGAAAGLARMLVRRFAAPRARRVAD